MQIYRRDKQTLTGLVERVDTRTSEPFHSAEELWAILTNARSRPRKVAVPALGCAFDEDLQSRFQIETPTIQSVRGLAELLHPVSASLSNHSYRATAGLRQAQAERLWDANYTAASNFGDIASFSCSTWERRLCRSAVRDMERPLNLTRYIPRPKFSAVSPESVSNR